MKLTDEQLKQAVEDIRNYPQGISDEQWGTGPVEDFDPASDLLEEAGLTRSQLIEFG